MAAISSTVGAPCASPVLPPLPTRLNRGRSSSPNSVSFARGIPSKAKLRLTATTASGATQTQTVQKNSTRIPNGPVSGMVLEKPKLDQGGGGFPPYRGGGGGGLGRSSGGFFLFIIIMLLDYMKEVEKKWFKFDDDEYYNQLSF